MTASRLVRHARRAQRATALALAACLTSVTLLPVAHAGMIGTPAVAQSLAPAVVADSPQARLLSTLDRSDVVQALAQRGVNAQDARDRVAALSDDQAQALLAQIDSAPAGASIIETVVFIFLVLLVTDILGFTKVYPFTRSIR